VSSLETSNTGSTRDIAALVNAIRDELPAVAALRADLHQWPELSGAEHGTRDRIRASLPDLEFRGTAQTGGVLVGVGTKPRIGLRIELDGLPITEDSGVPWQSKQPGVMHACGHDVHAAAAVAVVRALQAGTNAADRPAVALILQPREEKPPSGARDVIDSGVLRAVEVEAVIAAHLQPALPAGVISCTPGAVNASADEFTITIQGRPGHGAYPHRCDDVVLALAATVTALQQVVARNVDPMQSAAVTIGSVQAGSAANVLPDHAEAKGTLRALDANVRALLISRVEQVAVSTAAAYGCQATFSLHLGEPALVNDAELTALTTSVIGASSYRLDEDFRSMGADDFSYYAEVMPSLMMFVGVDSSHGGLHHPGFAPDHAVIADVAYALLAGYLGAELLLHRR